MLLFYLALSLIPLTWWSNSKNWPRLETISRIAFFFLLTAWLWISADFLSLVSGEEGLLRWYVYGLIAAGLGETLLLFAFGSALARSANPIAALFFAFGLDVFHPSSYAYSPAAILAVLITIVAVRVVLRLSRGAQNGGSGTTLLVITVHTASFSLLLFAGIFKLMDRNWLFSWSYLTSGGVLLLALSQLWRGAQKFMGKRAVSSLANTFAFQLGTAMIVIAAFFHYQQYF